MRRCNVAALFLACVAIVGTQASVQPTGSWSFASSDERRAKHFQEHPRAVLDVRPIAIKRVLDSLHCAFECLRNERCLSFNIRVKRSQEGEFDCQMLATDMSTSADKLKPSGEFSHHSSMVCVPRTLLGCEPCTRTPLGEVQGLGIISRFFFLFLLSLFL